MKSKNTTVSLNDIYEAPQPSAELVAAAAENDAEICAWSPTDINAFVSGQITAGELEGITKEDQYEIASIGHNLMNEGKLDSARRIFEGLHALDPFDAYFMTALGSIAQQRNETEAAEDHYTGALDINPYSITALAHRGEVRVLLGRLTDAASDLARVAELDPTGEDPATQRAAALAQIVWNQLEAEIAS